VECKLPGRYIDDSAIDSPGWVHILLGLSGAAGKVLWWVIECLLHMQLDCITLLNPPKPAKPQTKWAHAIVGLVQNRKEGLLVLLVKQDKTVLLGHDLGEINQNIHRQGINS
jgi:hypothetical protein